MDFSSLYQLKDKKFWWTNIVFYAVLTFLLITGLCYFFLLYQGYLQNQKIAELNTKILEYGNDSQKASERKILDYKKKIDDFTILLNDHRFSLNVYDFIEQKTLPNVWFLSFNVSAVKNEINLSGEAENMEALSNQLNVFEGTRDYINDIGVLGSQVTDSGRVSFTLRLSLNPKIFDYHSNPLMFSLPNSLGNVINNPPPTSTTP